MVLDDEPRIELLDASTLRLIVVLDEADLVVLVADLDAARFVDLVAPQLGALELGHRIRR